jgi:hypothetical protein
VKTVVRGVRRGLRARPWTFVGVAVAMLVVDVLAPPVVLSLTRKPWDYVTLNPWLSRLLGYLASPQVPLDKKLEFLPNLVLFWVSADSPQGGVEWGFAVTVTDVARFLLVAVLFALYFTLLMAWRQSRLATARASGLGARGGLFGAVATVFGFSTGACTVMGCGAPVIPVVGLAFVGLSSGTLAALSTLSRTATIVVVTVMTGSVLYLAWRTGGQPPSTTLT